MDFPSLGEQELEVLRYVSDNAPATVREVAEGFGEPRGLARTTILTVMERLRKKGLLLRSSEDGGYQYSPGISGAEVTRGLVRDFVDKKLAGSLSPFVAYLTEAKNLSTDEIAALRRLVDTLDGDAVTEKENL